MGRSIILTALFVVSSLFQPTSQVVLSWQLGEERAFHKTALTFIGSTIGTFSFKSFDSTVAVKCAGRRGAPYGIAIETLEMKKCKRVDEWSPPRCRGASQPGTVECQFAGRLDFMSSRRDNFLGLICYDKVSNVLDKGMSMEDICDKWRYRNSEVPQLQIPEHLKSPHSGLLAYIPPQIEKRTYSWSFFKNNWPKNAHERTGFGGLGNLEKMGPNFVVYFVISGQVGYDIKVVSEEGVGEFALPKYFPRDNSLSETFIADSAKELAREMGDCPDGELDLIVQKRKTLHVGYLRSPLNTDNAWLEGRIILIHDSSGDCFGLNYRRSQKNGRYSWASVPPYGSTLADFVTPLISPLIANYK